MEDEAGAAGVSLKEAARREMVGHQSKDSILLNLRVSRSNEEKSTPVWCVRSWRHSHRVGDPTLWETPAGDHCRLRGRYALGTDGLCWPWAGRTSLADETGGRAGAGCF